MNPQIFSVAGRKWYFTHVRNFLICGVVAVFLLLLYTGNRDTTLLIIAVVVALAAVISLLSLIGKRPQMAIDSEHLKFGKESVGFSQVLAVYKNPDEYIFMLSSRRRVVIDVSEFKKDDRTEIDKLIREAVESRLLEKNPVLNDADDNLAAYNFKFTEKHPRIAYMFFLICTVPYILAAVIILVVIAVDGFSALAQVIDSRFIIALFALWALLYLLVKIIPALTFEFENGTFTMRRKNKIIRRFTLPDVLGIELNPPAGYFIKFYFSGKTRPLAISLFYYKRKEVRQMKESLKSIFFLKE